MNEAGGITPQRDPQPRDMPTRQTNFDALEEYERQNLPQGNLRAGETHAMEREFFDEQHYDPNLPHQKGDAGFSERGRLVEVTGTYIDEVMERYTGKMVEVENNRIERKCGQGWVGRTRNWLANTVAGNRTSWVGKVTLGSAAHVASAFAPIAAPALHYAGNRLLMSGAVEMVQKEFFEIPRIERLETLRLGRHFWLRELARIRNELTLQSATGDPYARENVVGRAEDPAVLAAITADTAAAIGPVPPAGPPPLTVAATMNSGEEWTAQQQNIAFPGPNGAPAAEFILNTTTLDRRLEIIVEQMDMFEEQIHRTEEELANIRIIGRAIKAAAGIVLTAGTLIKLFTSGLSMGIQNFDLDTVSHEVMLRGHEFITTGKGVQFAYNTGEKLANGVSLHGIHDVGDAAPWLKIGSTVGGLVGGMVASAWNDFRSLGHDNALLHREAERRPEDQAVLSFKEAPRTTHGDDSGVHHEIEHVDTPVVTRDREEMNERKEMMTPGTVWRIDPADLPVGTVVPPNILNSSSVPGEILFQVVKWENQGLVFSFVTNDSSGNLNAEGIIVGPRLVARNADRTILNSKKEADSIDSTTSEAKIDKLLESRAEDLAVNKNRVVKTAINIGIRTIPAGNYLEFTRPGSAKDKIIVKEFDSVNAEVVPPLTITDANLNILEIILDNSEVIASRDEDKVKAEKAKNKKILSDINNIIKNHSASNGNELQRGQWFKMGTADNWLQVMNINDEEPGGIINVVIGDDFAAINATPDKKKKAALNDKVLESENRSFSFSEFKDFVDDGPSVGGVKSYTNRLIQTRI